MDSSKPDLKLWKFKVRNDTDYVGTMCIAGDCDSLGNWSTDHIIPLNLDNCTKFWTATLNIPADRDVHYRYFLCSFIESSNPPKTMIHQWETNLEPRSVKQSETLNELDEKVDIFGLSEQTEKIEKGWLTSDVVVQLRLNSYAIQWQTSNDENKKVNIKLLSAHRSNNVHSGKGCTEILVSVSNENGKFHTQDEDGYAFHDTDTAVFMTRAFSIDKLGFIVEFTDTSDDAETKKMYSFLVLENKYHNSYGTITVPIHSDQREYLGTLSVKYLIVRPTPELNCKLKVSYAKYWNNSWTGLEIGHRGSGVSYSKTKEKNAKLRENTIGSFKSAGQCGAHLIEFDVQLTNDLVPTIYHDFHVLLDVRKKNFDQSGRKMIFPFHKLNYEELKDFKVSHLAESNFTFSFENDDQEDYSPFPSLEQVLQSIDPRIGFNIEIKYNSELMDGSNELDHPIDMNEYVDRILKDVYANAGRRYIVFSSFNPDVCVMARMKQNKYPVMFLTQGITQRYPPYSDYRMSTIENAVKFANSADLLGIVAHSEELLKNYSHVKYVLNNNLVLFCWGDDNNDVNNICALREQGVHGIIFDRIDQYGQKLKRDFFQDGLAS